MVQKGLMIAEIGCFLEEGNYAESTRKLYEYYLEDLAVFLAGEPLDCLDLAGIRAWLSIRGWHGSARYSAACAARAFAKWRWGENHPMIKLKVRRPPSRPQRTLTLEQVQQLLLSIDTGRVSGIRNLALVTFMLDTGFRSAEVCGLKMEHLEIGRLRALAIVKGGEWGEGHFCEDTAGCLSAWLLIRSKLARPGVRTVFVGCETSVGKPLTTGGLRSIFRKMGQRAGLGLLSPHDMRRTACTLYLENGASTRLVQLALRWKSIGEVERYSRRLSARAALPFSPVARALKKGIEP